ncbi:MAG: hypothetical protein QM758_23355 [Armatimonas sp.]
MRRDGSDGKPRWTMVWERPAPSLLAFSLSPNGQTIAWLSEKGQVRRFHSETGDQLWRTPPISGMDSLAAAPGGQVLVWKRLAPQRAEIMILDAVSGISNARIQPISGPIWAVVVALDGKSYVVGAGDRSITRWALGGAASPPKTVHVEGYPETLALAQDGSFACGTWLPSGISTSKGWRHRETDPARWFDVTLSADGNTLVALSRHGARRRASASDPKLMVWDRPTGRLLWEQKIEGTEPRLLVSEDGGVIALSFVATTHYTTGDLSERRLSLFARNGSHLAPDRGGSYLAPELVALSASGNRITVLDMDRSLCTLDRAGRTVARLPLPLDPDTNQPHPIRSTQSSADGQTLLLHRGDGNLALYRATAE